MIVLVSGSRRIDQPEVVRKAIEESGVPITRLLSGGARGVDRLAEEWATERGIPIERVCPDWKRHGRGAGLRANVELVARAEAVVAIWDGESKGTADVILRAREVGKRVVVVTLDAPR